MARSLRCSVRLLVAALLLTALPLLAAAPPQPVTANPGAARFSARPWAAQLAAARAAMGKGAAELLLRNVSASAPDRPGAKGAPADLSTDFELVDKDGLNYLVFFTDGADPAAVHTMQTAARYRFSAAERRQMAAAEAAIRITPAEALARTRDRGQAFVAHGGAGTGHLAGPKVELASGRRRAQLARPPAWIVEYTDAANAKLVLAVDARTGEVSTPAAGEP